MKIIFTVRRQIRVQAVLLSLALIACGQSHSENHQDGAAPAEGRAEQSSSATARKPDAYRLPVLLADLEDRSVNESSGIVASRRNADIFWTHNDSGDGPFLYAFDRGGKRRGVWRVAGAEARDWEDIAIGPGPEPGRAYLYIGDIGDNGKERKEIVVYRVEEPEITAQDASASKENPRLTQPAEAIRLIYPDGKHDAEALMVHPVTGDLYIVTKKRDSAAGVYKLAAPINASGVNRMARVGEVSLPGLTGSLVTGGDIAPDGLRVALCDYFMAYEISLPTGAKDGFDSIWQNTPMPVNIGARSQGEAVCYRADGKALLATSEKVPCPLLEAARGDATH